MAKYMKLSLIIVLLSTFLVSVFAEQSDTPLLEFVPISFADQALATSNRFTQVDTIDVETLDAYDTQYRVAYSEVELEQLGFVYTLENNDFKIYFEPLSFSVIVEDKVSGFMVSSRAENQGILGVRENNTATRNLMNSGLWISYVRKANVLRSTEETKSLYSIAGVSYQTDGSVREGQDKLSVYAIQNDSYDEDAVDVQVNHVGNQLEVDVSILDIDITLKVLLSLSNEGLHVEVPVSEIIETSTIYALTKISIFPFFGSTREDLVPGYMVIPDGSGALIRFKGMIEDRIRSTFYGSDLGLGLNTSTYLSLPIIGMIHHIDHEGFYIRIDQGAPLTSLEAAFWSSNSKFNRASLSFQLRPIYRTIINQAGDGRDQIPQELTNKDYAITFAMLRENASYSGIANHYQDHLIETNAIASSETPSQVPLLTSFLMGDQAPSFLGTSYLTMTSSDKVLEITKILRELGVQTSIVELLGWSRDGHMDRTPYRDFRVSGLNQTLSELEALEIPYVLRQDYVYASELTRNLFYNRDVATNYSRLKMTDRMFSIGSRRIEGYYLYPDRSLAMAERQALEHISFPYLGNTLFSHYDNGFYDRLDALSLYEDIVKKSNTVMMTLPSKPYFQYLDYYQHMPFMHSNVYFYTDQVPLLQMILFGITPYFAQPLNFNALGQTFLLNMVDYGMFPHYILTDEKTETMRETRSSVYFTTAFETFKEDIIDNYEFLNEALKHVLGSRMIDRTMLASGVALVTYSNGVRIVINYTNASYTYQDVIVDASSYEVIR